MKLAKALAQTVGLGVFLALRNAPGQNAVPLTLVNISPHTYLVGKLEDQGRRFWFQANTEYPDRDSVLSVACTRKPNWQVEPPSVAKEARWDEKARRLSLRLAHHEGAVEVSFSQP